MLRAVASLAEDIRANISEASGLESLFARGAAEAVAHFIPISQFDPIPRSASTYSDISKIKRSTRDVSTEF